MTNENTYTMGAMLPPELAWQEGKTAGEIALIQFVLRTLMHLHIEAKPPAMVAPENTKLRQEATYLLNWYGVPVPELP